MLTVKVIENILKQEGRCEWLCAYPEGKSFTIDDLLSPKTWRKAKVSHLTHHEFIKGCDIWYEGNLIHPDDYATTQIEDCTEIIFFVRPGKGGVQAALGAVLTAVGIAVPPVGLLVPLGISMIIGGISQLLFTPKDDNINFENQTRTYGWEGIRTEYAAVGRKVPICYGRVITGGKVISQRIYATGGVIGGRVWMDALLLLSEGEIRGIRKQDDSGVCTSTSDNPWIKMDGKFISTLSGSSWDYRLGTTGQSAIQGISVLSNNYVSQQTLSTSWYTITNAAGGANFDTVEFNILFPVGIWILGSHGRYVWSVTVEFQKKEEPSGNWVSAGTQTWTGLEVGPVYRTFRVKNLGTKPYSFRMRRLRKDYSSYGSTGETVQILSYNQVLNDDLRYPGCALVSLHALATDQISTSQPTVEVKLDGRIIQYYDGTWQSETWDSGAADEGNVGRNPAWQIHDLIYNNTYGLGPYFDDSLKASAQFKDLADYANQTINDGDGGTEPTFRSDVVVDGIKDPWDMLQELLRSCHSFPLVAGAQIWPVVEKARSPVMSFGMDNIAMDDKGRTLLLETWRTWEDTPSLVEVQYFDATKNYVRESVQFPDDDSLIPTGEKIKKLVVIFHNVSRRSQATRLAKFYWLKGQKIKQFVKFPTNEEALALQPGDNFYLSHDIPQFDYSGKIFRYRAGDNIVELDNSWALVDESSAGTYRLLIRDSDDDTIEIKDVTSIETENNRHLVTFSGSYSFTPAVGDSYILIEDTQAPKQYVCTELARDDRLRRVIMAEEYDASIFSYEVTDIEDINYSDLPDPKDAPDPPTSLTLVVMTSRIGFYINAVTPEDIRYDHTRIFLSTDGNSWDEIGRVQDVKNFPVTDVIPGVTYYVKVVSYNRFGTPCANPPTASITIQGFAKPPTVTGLEIFGQGNDNEFVGRDCKIQWRLRGDFMGLGSGPLGAEGTGLGEGLPHYIKDTKVSVYVGGAHKRSEFVPASGNTYIYSFEKNVEDNGTPQRTFEFRLWYRDNYNQLSENYAALEVTNPAPSMAGLIPTVTGVFGGIKIDWSSIIPTHHDLDKFWVYVDSFTPPTTVRAKVDGNTTILYFGDLTAGTTYYVKVVPGDPYGMGTGSNITTAVGSVIPASNIDAELRGNLEITDSDSNPEETLAKLYDGNKVSDGVSYSPVSWDTWIQYHFPVDYIIDKVLVWPNAATYCYISYSSDGSTWSYLKAEADHTLDANGKLLAASDESDAQTNYWLTSSGVDMAVFPDGVVGKYFRIHLTLGVTIFELVFVREVVAEMIAAKSITANEIKGSDFGTLIITSGAVKFSSGTDLLLSGTVNNPAFLRFQDENNLNLETSMELRAGSGTPDYVVWYPSGTDGVRAFIGWPNGYLSKAGKEFDTISLRGLNVDAWAQQDLEDNYAGWQLSFSNGGYGGAGNWGKVRLAAAARLTASTYGAAQLELYFDGTGDSYIRLLADVTHPYSHKTRDFGKTDAAWAEAYADNWNNVADFFHLDSKDDLGAILQIQPSGEIDLRTGLPLIDDSTIPDWMKAKDKNTLEIALDPDGKCYLSSKMMFSVLMGAMRQIDTRLKILEGGLSE